MCGICGYYAFSDILPEKGKITKMFELLETRGRDASGFAFVENRNLVVNKAPVPSSEMVKSKEWIDLKLPKIMILHSRARTQGSEQNNYNNHPLFSKQGICIVHNGIIHNDEEIFGKKQKRDGEVDSEAILAILSSKSKEDKIKLVFDKLDGSFAVGVIDKNRPENLVLIKKDNPITLYYNTEDDILYFCSVKQIMKDSLKIESTTKRGFSLGEKDYHYYDMQNDHALIIDKDGVEMYKRYTPRVEYRMENEFYTYDDNYIECPYCYGYTEYDRLKLDNFCMQCGRMLKRKDQYDDMCF